MAKSATERAVVAVYGNDGSGSANQDESYINSSACFAIAEGGGPQIDNLADFVSWDADGFTLNYSANNLASRVFFGLILQGTFQAAIGTQARKITTTGTQNVTTPGFQPVGVLIAGGFATASATETTQSHLVLGAFDGSRNQGTWNSSAASINTDCNMYASAANCYTQATNPSTVAAQASGSLAATGYDLDWTTVDANARLFCHLALASAVQASRPMFRGS
jgi:hypothetical protein